MTIETETPGNSVPTARAWVLAVGVLPLVGTALLAGRLVWEQTVWTWERGPQMVGFSLAHGSGAIMLVAPLLLACWMVIVLAFIAADLARKKRTGIPTWAAFCLGALLYGILLVPGGVWQRLFIREMASSPRAADLLVYASYNRDFRTVRAMLSHGVSIAAIDHSERRTALHAAAIAGDLRTIQFLVSNGADVNALDRAGDSPTELAASQDHRECVLFLQGHGGKRIRGDEAQRQKAIQDQVHDDIEEMDRSRTQ